jgi:hypothetical protein
MSSLEKLLQDWAEAERRAIRAELDFERCTSPDDLRPLRLKAAELRLAAEVLYVEMKKHPGVSGS